MPLVHLIHTAIGYSSKPKEQIFDEDLEELGRVELDVAKLPKLSTAEVLNVIREVAPPEVPYDIAFVRTADLKGRYGRTETKAWSPMLSRFQATFNALPHKSAIVMVLFSDVVADYYNETIAEYVLRFINGRYGKGAATQSLSFLRLKEVASAAGLGYAGKNALFFSHRFGFHCKITVILTHMELDQYTPIPSDPVPKPSSKPQLAGWKLPACDTCNLCVQACPVGAYDNFVMENPVACERVISRDFFGHRRNHTCRACITSCPESTKLLKSVRAEGVPRNKFWDYDRQINALASMMHKQSFMEWVVQRYYYGGGIPGTKRDIEAPLRGQQCGFKDVPNASSEVNNGWITFLRSKVRPTKHGAKDDET